jgi:hypothetical protein
MPGAGFKIDDASWGWISHALEEELATDESPDTESSEQNDGMYFCVDKNL